MHFDSNVWHKQFITSHKNVNVVLFKLCGLCLPQCPTNPFRDVRGKLDWTTARLWIHLTRACVSPVQSFWEYMSTYSFVHVGVCGNDGDMNAEGVPAPISLCLKAWIPARPVHECASSKCRTPFLCKSRPDCLAGCICTMLTLIQSSYTEEEEGGGMVGAARRLLLTMTMPPDCSTVHMLIMGAMPMVVPWK